MEDVKVAYDQSSVTLRVAPDLEAGMHPVDISGGSYVDRRFILGRQWEADAARTNINFEVRVPPERDDGNSATSCGNSHYTVLRDCHDGTCCRGKEFHVQRMVSRMASVIVCVEYVRVCV